PDLPPAGQRDAGRPDGGPDERAAARGLAGRGRQRPQAPGRVERPGGRLPAVAPGALDPLAAPRGARLSPRPRSSVRGDDPTRLTRSPGQVRPPAPHRDGVRPPAIPADLVPRHVALVVDGDRPG